MTDTDILTGVAGIIRHELQAPGAEITGTTTADDIDGWDSLRHARILLAVEAHFGVTIGGARLFSLDTVGDLVAAVEDLVEPR